MTNGTPPPGSIFATFSERARRVITTANEIGRLQVHLDSGVVLAAITDEPQGVGAQALHEASVDVDDVIAGVRALEPSSVQPLTQIAFSPIAKRIIRTALAHGSASPDGLVTTEHLLLGVLDEPDSTASNILEALGIVPSELRATARRLREFGVTDAWVVSTEKLSIQESVELGHSPDRVWALVEPPEYASLLDPLVISGRRLRDGEREVHEHLMLLNGQQVTMRFEVITGVPGRSVTIRAAEPERPMFPATWSVEPSPRGSILAVQYDLDASELRRRERRGARESLQPGLHTMFARIQTVLDGGWTPDV